MDVSRLALFLCLAAPAFAQPEPKFEIATIKLAAPNAPRNVVVPSSPDRLSIPSMNLIWLIYTAYGEGMGTAYNVSGGPDWVNKTSFAIEAKAAKPSTQRELHLMLRALLEDRFALKLRTETRMGDQYALVLDHSDGKLGPNIEPWDGTCGGRPPASSDDDPVTPRCPSGYRPSGLVLEGATMFSVAELLSLPQSRALLGTIVHDATGLTGRYKMHLDFPFAPQRPADPGQPDFAPPSLFNAVREQWGVKLEKAKGALHVIVVESAIQPTEN
ncbi:MAG TPA: TIGR03435 family protein [Bryobacteraceae bacterium]|jgi:uncharacterized protein (TIGR03435 family)